MSEQKLSKLGQYLKDQGVTQKLLAIQLLKAYTFNAPPFRNVYQKIARLSRAKAKKKLSPMEIDEIVKILQKLDPEVSADKLFDIVK